ncbi:unnamed protein product [Nyctereutes procyonoides]|uniref:Vomeronasal type-1 receptor n=1 Tax=Nyctereutes procyonoides TaxID=34880 RepID=A0A811ZUX9_NYCPR|nr:unnamed protein product [Nyctereutes procyonoides]
MLVSEKHQISVDMIPVAPSSCSHAGSSVPEDKYQSLRPARMATRDLVVGVIFLIQTVNLIVANILVLFFGIHNAMPSFGLYYILSDFGCKFSPYVHGVGMGVSFGTTCLLSVFQAITISSRSSRWAVLKGKAVKYIVPSIVLCWVLHILVNIAIPVFMVLVLNNKNITRKSFGYCSTTHYDKTTDILNVMLFSFPDVLFLGLILSGSGSMVFILYRHKQRVQHILRTHVSSTLSPDTFVLFNTLSSIFHIVLGLSNNLNWSVLNTNLGLSLCFSTVSPFLLLSRDPRVSMVCFAWIRNTKSPHLIKNM